MLQRWSEDKFKELYDLVKAGPWFWDIAQSLHVDVTTQPPRFFYPDTQHPDNTGGYHYIGYVPKDEADNGAVQYKYEHDTKCGIVQYITLLLKAYENGHVQESTINSVIGWIQEDIINNKGLWTNYTQLAINELAKAEVNPLLEQYGIKERLIS